MYLLIELTRKEIIPYKGVKIDTFKIKGKIRHLKEKFMVINFMTEEVVFVKLRFTMVQLEVKEEK